MRFADTPELATWRTTVRSFLDEHWHSTGSDDESEAATSMENEEQFQARMKRSQAWLDKLGENGWIAPAWPKEYGGADMSVLEQFVLSQELTQAGAPTSRQMLNLVGPTIMLHGTDEQKAEHLPPMLRGEVAWCQGFSEPGSGSDLASLQTRAVRDGDDYVVNGQKIWTSGAHRADWMFMLARTDPDAPKHRGISYLLINMKDPGVSVRPLINMHDGHVFNEVFFEDVRVPVRNRIGEENRGWYVGTTTLDFERSNIARVVNIKKSLAKVLDYTQAREVNGEAVGRPQRMELADRAVETAVCELLSFQVVSIQASGGVPNMEASMNKMYGSELQQRVARTAMNITGMRGQLRQPEGLESEHGIQAAMNYLSTVPATIAAGTSEIQRNIIATRGLGLPRG
ncbi:MAG: acyl-CoA dehydrogenase family protein [Dehalococcoidia bacterium]|nr:acyl-CoA dehydrogenase family protein [Dehalococcoidia bacterium]MCA9843022.1 acyl-CoA dehydrogenase family protein [Dehalococcoidia bacterium]MCA9852062.1 acyl-CoA dehydrogenase family protein [Dehalococcoidia bacterium]